MGSACRAWTGSIYLLARSRRIELAGGEVETPLLVPSISSKAVGPIELTEGRKPVLVPASKVHTENLLPGIDEAVLVSAFDIHHEFITTPAAFRKGFKRSLYAGPRTLFIDSGWYEKSVGPESGQWYHEVGDALPFEEADYVKVIDDLDPDIEAVVVGWDHSPVSAGRGPPKRASYLDQIKATQKFFAAHKRVVGEILLKPEGQSRHHRFTTLSNDVAARLRKFALVGVTEKELGDTFLKRLTTLAQLRIRLDEAKVGAPIHVFGGLDPLATPLYFAAGGEVFDGLSWLRYAFRDGLCVHREASPILDHMYEKRLSLAVSSVQLDNLDAIAEMSRELKVFLHNGGDWAKLRRGDDLKRAFEAMESALGTSSGR